ASAEGRSRCRPDTGRDSPCMLAQLLQPVVKVQKRSRSCQAARLADRAPAQFLPPDSPTCTREFVGCAWARSQRSSLLELPLEVGNRMLREKTPFPWLQLFILQESDTYSAELLDWMSNGLKHSADLLISALMQRDSKPRILAAFQLDDFASRKPFVVDIRASPKSIEVTRAGHAGNFDMVDLWNNPRFRHGLRELAIVGENDQPLGTKVEAPDRVDTLFDFPFDILYDGWPTFRIARCGHNILGLVQQDINVPLCRSQFLDVYLDDIFNSVRLRTKFGDNVPVHTDSACRDHFLSVAAGGDTRVSQDLLQTFLHEMIVARKNSGSDT